MAATAKRAQPATHPTVYVGLALACIGLLLALYAYTGTRIYDVTFALVALGGALLAIAGIFLAAWGRAIMAARAQRSRRTLIHDDALKAAQEGLVAPPPTVAEPPSKKRFDFKLGARKPRPAQDEPAEKPAAKGAFAFRRRASSPPPTAPAEEGAVVAVAAEPHPAAEPAVAEAPAGPALERVTVRCPRCSTEFTAEGVRPIPILCPSCGLAGSL